MATQFNAEVISPTAVLFKGIVQEVVLPAHDGEVGVLAEHEDFIGQLGTGLLRMRDSNGASIDLVVNRGVFEIESGRLRVLTQSAFAPSQINVAETKEHLRQVEAELQNESAYDEDYPELKGELELDRAKLKACQMPKN